MAKKTKDAKESKPNGKQAAPAGYTQTSAPRGAQTWAHFEDLVDKDVKGRLLGRIKKPKPGLNGEAQYYYRIKLQEPAPGWLKPDKDSEAEKVEVKRGEILCIDEKSALQCLAPLTVDGGVYDVCIQVNEKIDLDSGGSYWPANVFHKLVGGSPRVVKEEAQASSDTQPDDIPF